MKLPDEKQPPKKRGGIPKGEFCPGCGGASTGIHLARELVPAPPPPKETN